MVFKLAGTRFFGTLIGVAVLFTTTMASSGHARTQEAASGARTPDVDAAWLGAILTNPSIPSDLRTGAAERLVSSSEPSALEQLERAIRDADELQMEVVASGIRQAGTVPASLLPVVLEHACRTMNLSASHVTILRSGRANSVAAIRAFANPEDPACHKVLIAGLLAVNDRAAADMLVDFLGMVEPGSEDAKTIDAGLQVFAGVTESRSRAQWIEWWKGFDKPTGEQEVVQRLEDRLAEANNRIELAQKRAELLARRLAETIARQLAMMPEADRNTKILELAGDEEAVVRLAAIAHVERMLRNGRIPSEELRVAMLLRLDDIDPTIRIRAAQMLDAMGVDDLGTRLVEAIGDETDPLVLEAVLEILGNRPVPGIVPIAVGLFESTEPSVTHAAAGAVAAVGRAGLLDEEMSTRVRESLKRRKDGINSRELAEVAVLAASDPSAEGPIALLNHEDPEVRRGAAEGMRARGARARLLEAAGDPVVARVATLAWSDPPWSLESVIALKQLRPRDEEEKNLAEWREATQAVLASLPLSFVLDADESLQGESSLFTARREALRRMAMSAELEEDRRILAAQRLADRLVENGLPIEAAAELRAAGATSASPLGDQLFRTLLLAESWQEAAEVRPDPAAWLVALEVRVTENREAASGLLLEIQRRFGEQLDSTQKMSWEAASRLVNPAPVEKDATAVADDEDRTQTKDTR